MNPIADKLLIRPDVESDVTTSGIIKTVKNVANTGTVLAISPDIDPDELLLKDGKALQVGDKVQYLPNHRIEEAGDILLGIDNVLLVYNGN